ncbi:hypothetical protein EDB86DRAFT_637198 [Lactarius hatsudake]|nr:hypothetical protein EDB86DRAFT_637198 [Lactarius hatsudake]
MFVPGPVISLAIKPVGTETPNFSRVLNRFQKEDPAFRVHIDHECKEVRVFHRSRGRVHGRCGGSVGRYAGYSSQFHGATQGKVDSAWSTRTIYRCSRTCRSSCKMRIASLCLTTKVDVAGV